MKTRVSKWLAAAAITAAAAACFAPPAQAYIEAPHTLGTIVTQSTNIVLMKVEKVDREKNLIIYRKVKDLKGTHPTDVIKHNIAKAGFHPREWQFSMEGAQVGNSAIFFHNNSSSETYNGYWYQAYPGDWWAMSHGEPFLLRTYSGKVDKLATVVTAMLAGQEVIVPCMVDTDKNALHTKSAKVQRMKVSTKLLDWNLKRDFAGFGSEDFRAIAGMPAFSQYTALTRTDPEAGGVATADIDGDGKTDVAVYGAGKVAVLKNAGSSFDETSIPYGGGARAASWGDWNGDAKPDLLLATPTGPVLLTNTGGGTFKDDSSLLPKEAYYALTSAAWIDADGDKKQDVLLANGYLGLRLYRNTGNVPGATPPGAPANAKVPVALAFEDLSDKWNLGKSGVAAGAKGFQLAVADVDGDGKQDFLYSAGSGVLVRNSGSGFAPMTDTGVAFKPGKVAPVLADFDGDAKPDVTLVDGNQVKLYQNRGGGKFADISAARGDLSNPIENVACLAWTDFSGAGKLDLMVGVIKGPNRFFKNTGDGRFADASEEIGLTQKVFNTRALAVLDLNGDKVPDLVLNNEGQESSILLGDPKRAAKKVALK